ncbi:MAG: carbonic anhydrase [Desulfomonile sp.]|nr:carbonic anhydrase [Desulfomonile sp.]
MGRNSSTSSHDSLAMLKEGNARFVSGRIDGRNRDRARRLETCEHGQSPAAILVSCSDSRVPPEIIFDTGIGDLFIIRVAGNICGPSEMGSIEYAVEHLRVPLLVVKGHSKCGAIRAVVKQEPVTRHFNSIAQRIMPAVKKVIDTKPSLSGDELVEECSKENVWQQIENLLLESSTVRNAVTYSYLEVIGAYYDLERGDVNWMGKHPNEYLLLNALADFKRETATSPGT